MTVKIVLCGPPQSGKSVLREGLKQAIRRIPDNTPYPYVITACPDGEGAWFQETSNRHNSEARRFKENYKKELGGFTPEFVKRVADSVRTCNLPLTFIDIGGRISDENRAICRHTTHAIIVYGDSEKLPEWREFCREIGVTIIAQIYSDYNGKQDEIQEVQSEMFLGSVHYLERGVDVSERPCIRELVKFIVTKFF